VCVADIVGSGSSVAVPALSATELEVIAPLHQHSHSPHTTTTTRVSTAPTPIALDRKRDFDPSPGAASNLTWHCQRPANLTTTAPTEARFKTFLSHLFKPP
jgi:hypothetical protein